MLSPGAAFAQCTYLASGGVLAPAGDVCYVSGSFATTGDGQIDGQASGAGALITGPSGGEEEGAGTISFSTSGASANAVQADTGGAVSLTSGTVITHQDGSIGLFASGTGSTITASGVAVTTSGGYNATSNTYANGLLAYAGGSITFSGGSITVNGLDSAAVAAVGTGSSITLNGGASVLTTGDGSAALNAIGTGSSLTANGITVTTHGNFEPNLGFEGIGAYNGSECTCNGSVTGGGTLSLINTTIITTGTDAEGVLTQNGGQTTISGGSITTSGDSAIGLHASGAGSSITTSNWTTIATGVPYDKSSAGSYAHGVQADTGGVVTLNGGSVSTAGNDAFGLFATGAGSSITTTNLREQAR